MNSSAFFFTLQRLFMLISSLLSGDISSSVCVSEFKALKSYSRNRYSRSVSLTNSYPGNNSKVGGANWAQPIQDESEDEFSGMGEVPTPQSNSLKVTHR